MVISEQGKISNILTKVNVLATTLAGNSSDLSNIIKNFSSISDTLAKANIASVLNNADVALSQASSILGKINRGEGTMGMLINNDSLYHKLDSSAAELDKLLEDLRLNPERYVHLSVFGKRDKNFMIASILFLLLLTAGIVLFTFNMRKVIRNIRLGKEIDRSDQPAKRWGIMLRVALGQSKMVTRPIPAILHIFVYVGFVIINIEVVEMFVDGIFGTHRFLSFTGGFYSFLIASF